MRNVLYTLLSISFYSKKSKDYSAPVTFISGGVKEGSDRKRQYDTDEEENMDNYEEEMSGNVASNM